MISITFSALHLLLHYIFSGSSPATFRVKLPKLNTIFLQLQLQKTRHKIKEKPKENMSNYNHYFCLSGPRCDALGKNRSENQVYVFAWLDRNQAQDKILPALDCVQGPAARYHEKPLKPNSLEKAKKKQCRFHANQKKKKQQQKEKENKVKSLHISWTRKGFALHWQIGKIIP